MLPENKKYILDNLGKKSIKQIAQDLGLKEKHVNAFLDKSTKKLQTLPRNIPRTNDRLYLASIFVLGFMIFSNTIGSSFHFDDEFTIVTNTSIRNLMDLEAILNAFNTRFIVGFTLALNYAIGGLNPLGYHLLNILIHIFSSGLVFYLIKFTLETPRLRNSKLAVHADLVAYFSTLLFLAHPIQTQTVNYIWQRAAGLAAFFYLGACVFYVKARLRNNRTNYAIALSSTVLGMLTKEITFTIPFALVLYDYIFFTDSSFLNKKRLLTLALFLVTLVVIPLMLTRAPKITNNIMRPESMTLNTAASDKAAFSIDMTRWVPENIMTRKEYLLTQLHVTCTYFRLFFVPRNQVLDYDYPITKSLDRNTGVCAFILAGILLLAVFLIRRYPMTSFGIFWIFLTLSIEAFVVQNDVIYEHRLYLPMVGFVFSFVPGAFELIKRPKIFSVSMAVLILLASVVAWNRNKVWKNEITLWSDVVKKSPAKARGHCALGGAYEKVSEEEKAVECYLKACACDREYERINGHYELAAFLDFTSLANIYRKQGKMEQSIQAYEDALKIKLATGGNPTKVYTNLANSYRAVNNEIKAEEYYEKAIAVDPNDPQICFNTGTFYMEQGKTAEAIAYLKKAAKMDPKMSAAYYHLGNTYLKLGQYESAEKSFEQAINEKPDFEEAKSGLQTAQDLLSGKQTDS